jgi:hypothetical protein
MLDTFIKNKGVTKTIIHNNNKNYYNEVNWDADYDGENANLTLDIVDDNGRKDHLEVKMNNDELAELLNIPSEKNMLDKRLYNDFLSTHPKHNYKMIELNDIPKSILHNGIPFPKDSYQKNKKKVHFKNQHEDEKSAMILLEPSTENEVVDNNYYTHISSPLPQEEFLFPLVINETKTRKHKNHKKPKTHVTHKAYKKHRVTPSTSSASSSRKTLRRRNKHHGHSRRTF